MELTPENTLRIYALPPAQLRRYLPRIFAKVRDPAPGDGPFVQSYVVSSLMVVTPLRTKRHPIIAGSQKDLYTTQVHADGPAASRNWLGQPARSLRGLWDSRDLHISTSTSPRRLSSSPLLCFRLACRHWYNSQRCTTTYPLQ